MTTIRKIVTSKVDGNSADSTDTNEIRPFGEIAVYLNTEPNPDKLTLMMFDGTRTHLKSMVLAPGRLYGSDADSGDGNNRDTIKLIPDASLSDYTGNDQYIIIDPTAGEPGHIHIRAGGTQDSSSADLYLGGELTAVRVSDTYNTVTIRTTNIGDPNITMDWIFDNQGYLSLPGIGNNRIGESEPGLVVSSDASVVLQSNNNIVNTYEVEFVGFIHNGFNDGPGATLTVTEIVAGTITDGMIIYGAGLPPEGWPLTIGGVPNAGSGGVGNYLLSGANILTSSQSFNNDVLAAGSQSWVFGTDGNLTFPDATVQTTAYTGTQTTLDGDVTGSVFADDSTLLVDGVSGKIVGYVENDRFTVDGNDYQVRIGVGAGATTQGTDAIAIGEGAGNYQQGTRSVAIGRGSGNADQGISAVGIGFCAGGAEQGDYAIAIGFKAGRGPMAGDPDPAQPNNSIIINASGDKLNGTNSGLYVDPVREDTGNTAKAVYYDTTTKELTYADPTGGGGSGDSLVSDNTNITVTINNAVDPGNTLTWTFDTDGFVNLPNGGVVGDIFGEGMAGIQANPNDSNSYASLVSSDKQQAVDANNDEVRILTDDSAQGGSSTQEWRFNRSGQMTFPDATVQTTAFVQGEQIFTVDTGATDYAPTAVDFNLLFVTPAIGYSAVTPTSVTLPNGVLGQRLVIFNGYSLATLTVNPGPLGRDISGGVIAEFIFTSMDGWIPLYGTNSPT